ncbi:MAG: outer membrane beta-barrel protein [Bacteroidia bacterium]
MKSKLIILLLLLTSKLFSQQLSLTGNVVDEKGSALSYVTIALMHPEDSTLAFFGVTNGEGSFEIKNISQGKYLLQAALISYQTYYKPIELPFQNGEKLNTILLKSKAVDLNAADVSAERIPLMLKKDTIEYDAAAFKTKPDAVAEDLLRKMPGIEVDRAGNIKAQGEDVKQVLVDGKEFFGNDPKVATKNLPADAIKKVQVYDKKSDEAELTGIADGERKKTINLTLKDDKKSAWFGDVQAGAGTDEHYQASAKVYRFSGKQQFAALGMLNNINKFGFSFSDYMDFNGGMHNMMDESNTFRLNMDDNSFPVNFGQPVTGLITSGAGGLNYTYEAKKNNRFNISYLANGADKKLEENTLTKNYTADDYFIENDTLHQTDKNRAQRLNFGWRNKSDSMQTVILSGGAVLTNGKTNAQSFEESYSDQILLNNLSSNTYNKANGVNGNAHAAYLKKGNSNWKLFKLSGDVSASQSLTKTEWENITNYFSTGEQLTNNQFQNNANNLIRYNAITSLTRKLYHDYYLEPMFGAGGANETLNRKQGVPPGEEQVIDSLSPDFTRSYNWLRPALRFKKNTEKTHFNITAEVEAGNMSNELNNESKESSDVFYFTPSASWEREYKTSRRLRAYYESRVNTPDASQLLPVANTINPLEVYNGNRKLKPEYVHEAQFNWMLFDQFSFTSVFVGLNGTYTKDKINWSRSIDNNLGQTLTLINVRDDYRAEANADYTTPIRKLGITLHASAKETYNRGINLVDNVENINTNFGNELTLSIDNRSKNKWDVSAGATAQITNSYYSVQQSLNDRYFNMAYFAELSYTPNDKWHFGTTADVTNYNAKSFHESISVPLLKAEMSYYFLKSKRGVITLEAFDILNKNTGVQRSSEANYLQQKQSNIIGRYAMLSFKYRLNKFDDKGGVKIEVNKR